MYCIYIYIYNIKQLNYEKTTITITNINRGNLCCLSFYNTNHFKNSLTMENLNKNLNEHLVETIEYLDSKLDKTIYVHESQAK